jgi:enoyl-[acyl-carrier protein] reductase III
LRTALVVGGTGGIGRAVASELCAREPTRLAMAYGSDDATGARAGAELRKAGYEALLVRADVTSDAGLASLEGLVEREFAGRLDVLVYSAAYRVLQPALEMPVEEWNRSLDVTLTGFVRCVQRLAAAFPEGGRVLAISGLSGVRVVSDLHLAMGTAKAGLHHAVRYLAAVLAPRGVNVNCLSLGAVLTEGVLDDLTPEQYRRFHLSVAERSPKGRVPEPAVVARVAGFLCSPDADWIVGQVIVADGGETLR